MLVKQQLYNDYICGKIDLREYSRLYYLYIIRPENEKRKQGKDRCHRCTVKIGKNYIFKEKYIHNGKQLCRSCYEDLSLH